MSLAIRLGLHTQTHTIVDADWDTIVDADWDTIVDADVARYTLGYTHTNTHHRRRGWAGTLASTRARLGCWAGIRDAGRVDEGWARLGCWAWPGLGSVTRDSRRRQIFDET